METKSDEPVEVRATAARKRSKLALGLMGMVAIITLAGAFGWWFGRSRTPAAAPTPAKAVSAFYASSSVGVGRDSEIPSASGGVRKLEAGDLVLVAVIGQLMRVADNGLVAVPGEDGESILLENLGPWNDATHSLLGLRAVNRTGRWVVEPFTGPPSNANACLCESPASSPLGDYWISPGDAKYRVQRQTDASGPFVRVTAMAAASYLVITGNVPVNSLDGVPVTIRAQIRSNANGHQVLTLYDEVSPGKSAPYTSATKAVGRWNTLTLWGKVMRWRSPNDNYSIGLTEVKTGDWFEVREISVYKGVLPL